MLLASTKYRRQHLGFHQPLGGAIIELHGDSKTAVLRFGYCEPYPAYLGPSRPTWGP